MHVSRGGQLTPYGDPHGVLAETKAGLDHIVRERAYLLWERAVGRMAAPTTSGTKRSMNASANAPTRYGSARAVRKAKRTSTGFGRARLKRLEALSVMKIERLRCKAGYLVSFGRTLYTKKWRSSKEYVIGGVDTRKDLHVQRSSTNRIGSLEGDPSPRRQAPVVGAGRATSSIYDADDDAD